MIWPRYQRDIKNELALANLSMFHARSRYIEPIIRVITARVGSQQKKKTVIAYFPPE